MKLVAMSFVIMLIWMTPRAAISAVQHEGDRIVLSGSAYTAAFSAANGSILSLSQTNKTGSILRSGEWGLWHARFQDGAVINAVDFDSRSTRRSFLCRTDAAADALKMVFRSSEVTVTVNVIGRPHGMDFSAKIAPREKTILDFALPARLRFDPGRLERFISPMNGNMSVGAAFNRAFFQRQPRDRPSAWRPKAIGPKGYKTLYGAALDQRADYDPPTTLRVTPEGRQWLGSNLAKRLDGVKAVVNRPPMPSQADLVLVDSPNGPYFSAAHLGGSGLIWRIGGPVTEQEERNVSDMVMTVIERLAASPPAGRDKLGIVVLKHGPNQGGWTSLPVRDWLGRFRRRAARRRAAQLVELTTPQEMMNALNANDFFAILNPYGEWIPALEDKDMDATIDAVGRYVRAGGDWFEVGGYPFYYALRPVLYFHYRTPYPDGFADFFHLDAQAGSVSIYRVQPRKWGPWEGAKNKEAVFVPGSLGCGGDEGGGYCDRSFGAYVEPGETWSSPAARLTIGQSAAEGLLAYCKDNEIERRLEDKMPPSLLKKLKESVLVYYDGSCREKIEHLGLLPVPTLIHFADYLKGGFDKQYPDHLPPRPSFGAPEEFHAFFNRSHELGHLVMPYTNPTWWCDHPKGPTFKRDGDAPLLRKLNGKLSHERYGPNDGFTVCHWHPAVQNANRRTLRQFSKEYPADILFQDQCGARNWRYDANPASPTPYAYSEGLISMVAEDSETMPLSTESGWDRVVNYESQLCGMSWAIVPTEGGPSWRRLMKHNYPPETWEIFPLAQYIAHDKTAMLHHDLGQFVTNREVIAWTLGLGFSMSYRIGASSLPQDAPREWLKWLDRLQKSVCARYVGEPIKAFEHDRGRKASLEDDGVLRATYGKVRVIANIGPTPRVEGGHELPPYGFYATGPGLVAANLRKLGEVEFGEDGVSFVVEGGARRAVAWVYAPQGQKVCVELPAGMSGEVSVTLQDGAAVRETVVNGAVRFRLPRRPGRKRVAPPPALADKAPLNWPGGRPAIGILDMRDGTGMVWTRITPSDWLQAFQESRLSKELGAPIKRITTVEGLAAALDAGPTAWLAIINPYGEAFPAAPGRWRDMLDMIRRYVSNGGCWWETGGYSFYQAFSLKGGEWQSEYIGPWGMSFIGVPVAGGEVDQPREPLTVTAEGRRWLGPNLSNQVGKAMSVVNRGLSRGGDDPGHVALVAGEKHDFIGGYRLDGWGWLWRIGGFWPNPDVALSVSVAAMEYIYARPPLPVKVGGIKYLWRAVIETR